MKKLTKAGRLGDVTKWLQTQRRDNQWRMQNFAFPLFFRGAHKVGGPEYHPREIFKTSCVAIAVEKCDASTSQSTRRRFKP